MDLCFLDVVKLLLILLLLFIGSTIYEFLYKPWSYRRFYSKYPNISMADKFYPMLGDVKLIQQNVTNGKAGFHHFIEEAIEKGEEIDIRLTQMGPVTRFEPCSIKAFKEFEKLVPDKLDRKDKGLAPTTRLFNGSVALRNSDESWHNRRIAITKLLGINKCSEYIKMMNQTIDTQIDLLKEGDQINFGDLLASITFMIISKILFGSDIEDDMPRATYIDPKTKIKESVSFKDLFLRTCKNEFEAFTSPVGKLFPTLAQNNLVEPFKTNSKNIAEFRRAITDFCEKSSDKNSIYNFLRNYDTSNNGAASDGKSIKGIPKDHCVNDTLVLLFGGFDTTSHTVTSALYLLKRNPDKLDKLMNNLKDHKIDEIDTQTDTEAKDNLQSCDYLFHCIKEALRIDNAAGFSLYYEVKEDISICDIPIYKGDNMNINLIHPHFNSKQYHKPLEFIPERFDSNSEYFYQPGSDKVPRDPKSYVPFTFGQRNCTGQTLAKLESRVLLARILAKLDFEIDKEILDNPYLRFNIFEKAQLTGKITKKK